MRAATMTATFVESTQAPHTHPAMPAWGAQPVTPKVYVMPVSQRVMCDRAAAER